MAITANLYAYGITAPVAGIELVRGFIGVRASRSTFHRDNRDAAWTGGHSNVNAAPADAMTGAATFAFQGATAYARAKAAYESICTGTAHRLAHLGTAQPTDSWYWMHDGNASIALEPGTRDVWTVTVDWRALD